MIIGISGSPRDKNTNYMLKTVLDATGEEYELILLKDYEIRDCDAQKGCYKSHKCAESDDMQKIYPKLEEADAIILASPTYFSNVSSRMAMFIERTGIMTRTNGNLLQNKVGASVAIARRAGHNVVYSILNYYLKFLLTPRPNIVFSLMIFY